MTLRVNRSTTPEPADAQALGDLKRHLRIEGDYADGELTAFLGRAIDYLENRTRRQIFTATLTYKLDAFPLTDTILIPRSPLQSVTAITYTDNDDTAQTWASTNYDVITDAEPGYIRKKYSGGQWANYPTNRPRDVVIEYVAGYGTDWESLPGLLQQCLCHLVTHYYYERSSNADIGGIEHCIQGLIVGDEFTW